MGYTTQARPNNAQNITIKLREEFHKIIPDSGRNETAAVGLEIIFVAEKKMKFQDIDASIDTNGLGFGDTGVRRRGMGCRSSHQWQD